MSTVLSKHAGLSEHRSMAFSRTWIGIFSALLSCSVLVSALSLGLQAQEDAVSGAKVNRRATLPPQVEKIDKAMAAAWTDARIRPAAVEDDLKWCRRVYLDIIGRIPSFEEMSVFARDKSPDRRVKIGRAHV